jgi:1-deoxy-D-xylulose-5-phosphate synthase
MAPSNAIEMYQMLNTAYQFNGPVCVRYPRGVSVIKDYTTNNTIKIGKANIARIGKKIAVFAFGTTLDQALIAGEMLDATIVDMRFIKPLDEQLILELSKTHQKFITIEDNAITGGAGSGVSELLHAHKINTPLTLLGLPDIFTEQGSQEELYTLYGIDADAIIRATQS